MIRGQDRGHKFKHYKQKGCKHCAHVITFAMWNVRTLVENAGGDRWICRLRPGPRSQVVEHSTSPHCVDRKLDLLVKDVKRLGVVVAGIQETKWFGGDIWTADGYTLLQSGRHFQSPTGEE